MIATVEVIRAIKIPAGSTLDGAIVSADTWAMPGRHDIDADLLAQMEWESRGYVELEAIDGKPVMWEACCKCS